MIDKQKATERLKKFCNEWRSMRGNDHKVIYTLHSEHEPKYAQLLTTDIEDLITALSEHGVCEGVDEYNPKTVAAILKACDSEPVGSFTVEEFDAWLASPQPQLGVWQDVKWYGYAGHFIGGKRCAFHLSTRVPGYLISTVGHYIPDSDDMVPIGAGDEAFYETYVFKCDGEDKHGNPNVTDWGEIDSERYADSVKAEAGHYKYLSKYMSLSPPASQKGE